MNYIENYEQVLDVVKKYITKKESIDLINQGYIFVKEKHKDQKRKSGEPYLIHLINVAYLLATWNMGPNVICAGLLHDSIEDQNVTVDELKAEFNEDIANMVWGLTKVSRYSHANQELVDSINMQKIILAMSQDIRIILIKIADRLHNINTLEYMAPDRQIDISRKTQNIYLPIARRLGLEKAIDSFSIKIFEYLYPTEFVALSSNILLASEKNQKFINNFVEELKDYLLGKVKVNKVFGRVKNLYSIYKKIIEKNHSINDIHDINAIRIIVDNVSDCYAVVGYLQSKYRFIQERFKDYIVKPKSNLYQSIHMTIVLSKKTVEIQIRTEEMDIIAKNGLAAHWSYKEKLSNKDLLQRQEDINSQLIMLQNEAEHIENKPFITDEKKHDTQLVHDVVFKKNIYVVTPRGDSFQMAINSTALDFAFRVHSNVGLSAQSAIINDKMATLDTILNNGDIIEIKKSSNVKPNREWLKKVVTNHAISCIKKFLKLEMESKKISDTKSGEEILKNYIAKNEKYKVYFYNNDFLEKIGSKTYKEFYYKLSKKKFTLAEVFKLYENRVEKEKKAIRSEKPKNLYNNFIIKGLDNIQINTAKCCLPIPGDLLVGIIGKYTGIKVHRVGCLNITQSIEEKIIYDVTWNENVSNSFSESKFLVKFDSTRLADDNIKELINHITKMNAQVREFYSKTNSATFTEATIKVLIKNLDDLNLLFNSIQKVKNVIEIKRIF